MSRWISTAAAWTHVAFYERENARQRISAKLRTGTIPAWAKFFTFRDSEYRDAEMPIAFWDAWAALDYAKGEARRSISHPQAIPDPQERGYIFPTISNDRAEGVCLGADALYSYWPKPPGTNNPKLVERPHPGGRPPAADWFEIEKRVAAEIEKVGFPSRDGVPGWRYKADVVRFIRPLLGDDEPGETALKENVAAMLERLQSKKAGN